MRIFYRMHPPRFLGKMHKVKAALASAQAPNTKISVETIPDSTGGTSGPAPPPAAEAAAAALSTAAKLPNMGKFADKMTRRGSRKPSVGPQPAPHVGSSPTTSLSSVSATSTKKKEVKSKFGSKMISKMSLGKKKREEVGLRDDSPRRSKDMKVRLFFKERPYSLTDEEVLANMGREAIVQKEVGVGIDQIAKVVSFPSLNSSSGNSILQK